MNVVVYSICKDEADRMPFFLRHYSSFADRIIIFDEQSSDGTREIVKSFPKAEIREWPHKGLDDERFLEAVNSWWRESRGRARWVMWPDTDELLYHPEILDVLASAKEDMVLATGYALISENGIPKDDGRQIYEQVRTGIRQSNYDKLICWRPSVDVRHTIGRHSYGKEWPKCSGTIGITPKLKLFHLHHLGGAEWTRQINQRNFSRAVNKKYAWNYAAEHNVHTQIGTEAWARHAIELKQLKDVVTTERTPMKKYHLGCGGGKLVGWENYDMEVDLRKPLPFEDRTASFIFAEHVIEHLTHQEAWEFLEECRRVLSPRGVVRIAIPDVARIHKNMTPEYQKAVQFGGHGDGSHKSAVRAAVFEHGHKAAWSLDLLLAVMEVIGFLATACEAGRSTHPELNGIEQHGKVVGYAIARVETSVVEGTKI